MELVIGNEAELANLVANEFSKTLQRKPDAVFGLATGSSPLRIYDELALRVKSGAISFSKASAFTLDEYVGLPEGHPESYRQVIQRDFLGKVDFQADNVKSLNGTAADLEKECLDYESAIDASGGVDLQILGIGSNGHIAFNEPGSSFSSSTGIRLLSPQTRQDNSRFFGGDLDAVPKYCMTQGLGTIMKARKIVLVANGLNKAEAISQLVEGPISSFWPATILQHHPDTTVFIDEEAASKLTMADFYKYSAANQWPAK